MTPTCTWTSTLARGEMRRLYTRQVIQRIGWSGLTVVVMEPFMLIFGLLMESQWVVMISVIGTTMVVVFAVMCAVSIRYRLRSGFRATNQVSVTYSSADGRLRLMWGDNDCTFPFTEYASVERVAGYVLVLTQEGQMVSLRHSDLPSAMRELLGVQGVA